jgi:hypothetical protein
MSEAFEGTPAQRIEKALAQRRISVGKERFAQRALPEQLLIRTTVYRADFYRAGSDLDSFYYESESPVTVDPIGPIKLILLVPDRIDASSLVQQFDRSLQRVESVLPSLLRDIESDLLDLAQSYEFHVEFGRELQFPRFWLSFVPSWLCVGLENEYNLFFDNPSDNFHGLDLRLEFNAQGQASVSFDG